MTYIIVGCLVLLGLCIYFLYRVADNAIASEDYDFIGMQEEIEDLKVQLDQKTYWASFWQKQAERVHYEMVHGKEHDYKKCFCTIEDGIYDQDKTA